MVDMTYCGNCICIDYILCNISIMIGKKMLMMFTLFMKTMAKI